tara:strand:- start:488 stop:748 length:261 start_codon:yes stop_codon:yes gene_type:complete
MKFVILVMMLFPTPTDRGWEDSVYITHENNKPLEFVSQDNCAKYVTENQRNILLFAYNSFEGKAIPGSILCVPKDAQLEDKQGLET